LCNHRLDRHGPWLRPTPQCGAWQRKHYAPEEKVALTWSRVPHDMRDQIADFIRRWAEKTEVGSGRFIGWLDIIASNFYDWRDRYGKVNEHNGWVPRDFWLEDARRLVEGYVEHYNDFRLNSAIGYITPKDMLAGRQPEIHAELFSVAADIRRHYAVTHGLYS
jgi:hypothetical protein